jgi:hypothetical protein
MAARPPQHDGAGWFTAPTQVNHRRYEALRAYFTEGLTYQQAADRFGYTRWAMVNLVRGWRAGRLELFAPTRKPGPAPRRPSSVSAAGCSSCAAKANQRPDPGRRHHDHPGPARQAQPPRRPRIGRRAPDQLPRRPPPAHRHRPGHHAPTVIISNDHHSTTKAIIQRYARRMTIEQRLAEIIRAFCADALSSTVNLNVDLDVMLAVLA